MSTIPAPPTVGAERQAAAAAPAMATRRSPWAWMVVACALLAAAFGARLWQGRRFQTENERGIAKIPFDLEGLPARVGRFRSQEGIDFRLDPETVRYAGGLDHLVRTYTDEETGVRLLVMVLYGRADRVMEHVPELCYGGAGYQQVEGNLDRPITFRRPGGDEGRAIFRSAVFAKALGSASSGREEAYFAFRNRGAWNPVSPLTGHNRRPVGVYKIQIQRRLGDAEKRETAAKARELNPSESFLAEFVAAFEGLLAEAETIATPAG